MSLLVNCFAKSAHRILIENQLVIITNNKTYISKTNLQKLGPTSQ